MTLLLSLSMICCLAACGNSAGQTGSPSAGSSSATGNDAGSSTFVESYDFAGKTIVPFCTSGGRDSQDTVMEWVNGLDLHLGE